MQIQLQINENKIDFFLEYLNSLKDRTIEKERFKESQVKVLWLIIWMR